jgi:OmpA-OmpF porin, OOP family
MKSFTYFILFVLMTTTVTQAQVLKKIEKAAKRGAERTVERRVEKEASKKTDEVLDEVFDPGKKAPDRQQTETKRQASSAAGSHSSSASDPELNFTGTVIFHDDFQTTRKGDFPGKFISSTGGEVVGLGAANGLKFYPNSNVIPNLKNLPDNFALEFDLTLENVPPSLHNTFFNVYLQELQTLRHNDPKNKYGAVGFSLWGDARSHQIDVFNHKATFEIKEKIPYSISTNVIDKTSKFTLLKNGNRLRLFINGNKIVDSPNLLQGVKTNHINFRLNGTKKEEHSFIVSNLKITSIGDDLRKQLIEEGAFTTSNILFASGSDNIQPSSFSILDEIVAVIASDNSNFQIIGHTDSDGDASANLNLSKRRAESVKNYLVSKGISASRLQTDGKGKSQPIASNSTAEGKAQNRRVEFLRK